MVLQKQDKNSQTNSFNVDNQIIKTAKSLKLFGLTNGIQLRLDESNLHNKCSMQLNAINRLKKYMG